MFLLDCIKLAVQHDKDSGHLGSKEKKISLYLPHWIWNLPLFLPASLFQILRPMFKLISIWNSLMLHRVYLSFQHLTDSKGHNFSLYAFQTWLVYEARPWSIFLMARMLAVEEEAIKKGWGTFLTSTPNNFTSKLARIQYNGICYCWKI